MKRGLAWQHLSALLVLACLLLGPRPAHAQSCSATSPNLAFPTTVNPISGTSYTTTASMTVTCGGFLLGGNVLVCLSIGSGSTNTSLVPRAMSSSTSTMSYNIYSDPAYSVVWGNNVSTSPQMVATSVSTGALGGSNHVNLTVYSSLGPSLNTAAPGSYSESFSGSNASLLWYNYSLLGSNTCANPGISLSSGSANFPFTVTATALANCTIATPGTLNFGSKGVIASALSASTSVSVTCTNTTPYDIGLDAGQGSGATTALGGRKMTGAAHGGSVAYSLCRDSGCTQSWGTAIGTDTSHQIGTGSAQSWTIYGKVAAPTTQPLPDTYNDSVLASVTY
jgi:spore coat protein U-like protein